MFLIFLDRCCRKIGVVDFESFQDILFSDGKYCASSFHPLICRFVIGDTIWEICPILVGVYSVPPFVLWDFEDFLEGFLFDRSWWLSGKCNSVMGVCIVEGSMGNMSGVPYRAGVVFVCADTTERRLQWVICFANFLLIWGRG